MTQIIQRSFTSGEIAPSLQSRADLVKYATGLALCSDFLVRAQGGVYSRPGLRFVGEVGQSSKRARLIPFSFNTEQTYILVFEDLTMRVVKDGVFVLAGGGPAIFEIVTPYTEAQLSRLVFTQSADVMTIVHPSHDDRDLSRTADDAWTLTVNDYSSVVAAPVFTTALISTPITAITQANPAVVTLAGHGFADGDSVEITNVLGMIEVNDRIFTVANQTANTFELKDEDSTGFTAYTSAGDVERFAGATNVGADAAATEDKTYTYVITTVDDDGVESLASESVSITSKSLSVTLGVRLSWSEVAAANFYRIYKDPSNNTDVFGFIGTSNRTIFEDYNIAPLTSTSPPEDRQPFTGADNKPSAVNYFQQRLIFANTINEPQAVFTTQTANFKSLRRSEPSRDDDAITFTIVGKQVNEIRHIISLDSLLLLTSGAEWKVTEGQDQVLTPSTVGARIQSYNGASFVAPVIVNDTVLYVQEKGARIRDLGYEFSSDKFTGNDLSIMSEHLFENFEIEEMAYADEPYGIVWCIRDDGILLGLTYLREHQVWGWHQHTTQGTYESVATITEDGRDALYVSVKRTINGSVKRYIERMESRIVDDARNSFFVDSGLTLDNPSTITGATQSDPVVITDVAHGYSDGDFVDIEKVVGMIEINDIQFKIKNKTANTYELTDRNTDANIDGTGFTAYISDGESREAVTAISGLGHLEGASVAVLANGNEVTGLTVALGAITLPRPSSKVHVGLSYTPTIETLDIDTASVETLKGKKVTVSQVVIEFQNSRGGFVGPKKDDGTTGQFFEIKPRFDSDNYDPIKLKTFKADVTIEPQWSLGGGLRIEQRSPLPMAILSVIPDIDIGGN